jgi:hypothetical protein
LKKKRAGFLATVSLAAGGLIAACSAAAQSEDDSGAAGQDRPPKDAGEADSGEPHSRTPRSGEVDLQKLTESPPENEGNIVQPAPGVPDPTARLVQRAKQELAARTGRDVSEIRLSGVEPVDWPDSSLGCPQEGRMYLQVITPGYRITLELDGVNYRFHTDRGTHVVFCPQE